MNSSTVLPHVLREPVTNAVAVLLESRIPVRLAWVGADGSPRVAPLWFEWSGTELVMGTFAGSAKLAALQTGTAVAATIDTAAFPYRSLAMRGTITRHDVEGLAPEYQAAASRYLGTMLASRWLEHLQGADQVVLALRPTWARTSDMAVDSPFMRVLE